MSKSKSRRARALMPASPAVAAAHRRAPAAQAPQISMPPAEDKKSRPPGQRLFDLPYGAQVPSPVRPGLGLVSLVARLGHNAGYDIDLTLLDAADHRLIRTGVVLAHRVLDGRGEWYLGAPEWAPLLPSDLVVAMSQAELPDDLAELVRPFRRGAPLAPVAALGCQRREFALRDREGRTVALLRDDRVTVRRAGLITARYREVLMTPVGPGLDAAQSEWLGQCLASAGATEVDHFPRLVRRLGAPATGPSDLPMPADLVAGTFGQFLTQLLGSGARELITADLALTAGDQSARVRLTESVETLRGRLLGLRAVLGAEWVDEVVEDLDWLVALPDPEPAVGGSRPGDQIGPDGLAGLGGPAGSAGGASISLPAGGCKARLHSYRYLTLLDRLVAAARAPRSTVEPSQPAIRGIAGLYTAALEGYTEAANRLAVDGTRQTWDAAWSAARDLERAASIWALAEPEQTTKDLKALDPGCRLLEQVHQSDQGADAITAGVSELTPDEAFDAGRRYEREREATRALRSEFVARWARTRRKLR